MLGGKMVTRNEDFEDKKWRERLKVLNKAAKGYVQKKTWQGSLNS